MAHPNSSLASLDHHDESVRIAVRALGDMRNGPPRPEGSRQPNNPSVSSSSSSAPSSSQPYPSSSSSSSSSTSHPNSRPDQSPSPASPAFVARMTNLPLVGSALRVYEHGKASSRVVKYGAEMVESSVKTLSKPVIDRLPVNVNQLDEFACRQLDRLDRYRQPSNGEPNTIAPAPSIEPPTSSERGRTTTRMQGSPLHDSHSMERSQSRGGEHHQQGSPTSAVRLRKGWKEGGERGVSSWLEATGSYSTSSSRPVSRSVTPTRKADRDAPTRKGSTNQVEAASEDTDNRQVAQRSRWQAVFLEAGGLSAALSEDSMRRLKYCLQWLQYATAHIDAQILILREFTASLQTYPPSAPPHLSSSSSDSAPSSSSPHRHTHPPLSPAHLQKLAEVRRDVVQTVRQVVDVVSKYAGGALPEPARSRVRGFVLELPARWASARRGAGGSGSAGSSATTATGAAGLSDAVGGSKSIGDSERESVAAAGSGTGASTRRSGQRRAAYRERGTGSWNGSGDRDVGEQHGAVVRSTQSSRAGSPTSPRVSRGSVASSASGGSQGHSGQLSHGAAMVTAQRILSLATESLDMMRGVTGVVKDSLDRAESWVARLGAVGIQRRGGEGGEGEGDRAVDVDGDGDIGIRDFESMSVSVPDPQRHTYPGRQEQKREWEWGLQRGYESQHGYGHEVARDYRGSGSGSGGNGGEYVHTHSRMSSSQLSEDASVPPMSPFVSGASSTAWSSVPSTPSVSVGAGVGCGYAVGGGERTGGSFSPGGVLPPIGRMSIRSRGGTPRSVVGELPAEGEERMRGVEGEEGEVGEGEGASERFGGVKDRDGKERERAREVGEVKVVGVDVDVDERGIGMDVDV